jgi:hypothetical protein
MIVKTNKGEQMNKENELMTEDERFVQAEKNLKGRFEDWRSEIDEDGFQDPDVLGITPRIVTTITISMGGPASWIEYDHQTGDAIYYTTEPDYAKRGGTPDRVVLTREQTEELERLFALDQVARLSAEDGELFG